MKPLHTRLQLYLDGSDAYIFVPFDNPNQALTIYRSSGEIVLNNNAITIPPSARRSNHAVYGIPDYIVLLTGREIRGNINGHDIYRATDFDILPLNPNISVTHPSHPVEGHLLSLLRSHFQSGLFWVSYDWDITRRFQTQWSSREEHLNKALFEVCDDRFFWNKFLQARFIEHHNESRQDLSNFILPLLYGTFDMRLIALHGRRMQLALISRRSRFRAGTRYLRRGIDEFLFVDSGEKSSLSDDEFPIRMSYVQVRGSVNTLRYVPDLQVMELEGTNNAMHRHLNELVSIYGDQVLVNLVNHTGHEKPVKEAYERHVLEVAHPQVHYEYFDFHNECRKMRWDRISLLTDRVQKQLEAQGYYESRGDETPVSLQNGTVRTNCMDNLDRTGVVQAALAKRVLNLQLVSLGILPEGSTIDNYEEFSLQFREMWADHADLIAHAYAGSGALKSDYTRTNKRTRKGLLEDGIKSTVRYLKNNYFDGPRQDAFDLVLGNWIPRKNPSYSSWLISDPRPLLTRSMPIVASFSLFMICAGLTLPRSSDYALVYYFAFYIRMNGLDYVSWPKLLPPNDPPAGVDVLYYKGPGFQETRHGRGFSAESLPLGPARKAVRKKGLGSHTIVDEKKRG
ncbi:inositol phosphatidylinositol phosphatase [Flagelloscypha sp. PMI_526]|nr:inositol phosphatidylinositol phosphatase [Flagelloscypha sp. PMI_526]